jgi:glucose/arabinose dehydrogenase
MRAGRRAVGAIATAAIMVAAITVAANHSATAAPNLAPGFSRVVIPTGIPLGRLVNFEFLPSGDILAIGKCGEIRRLPVTGGSVALPTLPVNCDHDRGLLGFDLAPDFETSRQAYTLYNYTSAGRIWARLSRWTLNDASAPTLFANEQVVLDGLPSHSATGATCDNSHTIGTVLAQPDGTLFVGNGEAASYCSVDATALSALDITSPRGKIFRINPDGTGVPTNPFFDTANPSSWKSRVFAYGVRNPFRFGMHPASQALYVGDVGWNTYEELNVAVGAGENFGWPCWEGPLSNRNNYQTRPECQAAYQSMQPTAPLHSWPHAGSDAAAVGGVFYEGDSYPVDYRGAFFFGDYAQSRIWTVRTNASHQVVRSPEANGFGSDIGAPVAFRSGPGDDVFYADIASSNIYRLRYAPGNRAPVAMIQPDRTAGDAPLTVAFDGSGSYDLDEEPVQHQWAFGDGTSATGPVVSHTYNGDGPYTATLTANRHS